MHDFPPYCVHTADIAAEWSSKDPNPCRSVNELIDLRARTHPDQLAAAFPEPGPDGKDWRNIEYTFAVLRDASLALAQQYAHILPCRTDKDAKLNVALMCPSGPEYLLTMLACIRLGLGVLLLAPQLNAEAVAHLIKATECTHVLVHGTMKAVAEAAAVDQVQQVALERLEEGKPYSMELQTLSPADEADTTAIFFHTSGSSGMPKPIAIAHRLITSVYPCCPGSTDAGANAAFCTTPLFHGGTSDLFRALNSLEPIFFFPLHCLPVTADHVLNALRCAGPTVHYFFTVPFILKLLVEAEAVEPLIRMDLVSTGGAPLSDEIGDDLVKRGVPLVSRYGSSECGFLMSSHRDYAADKEWQWLREPADTAISRFRELRVIDDTSAELILHPGWPHQVLSNRPDGSYATGDLFTKHPSIPHAWRYAGRADDILVMSNGEKTDPTPIEARLRSSALLREAVVFGSDRPATGVLLLFQKDIVNERTKAELVELIWPDVVEANKLAPAHSQLLREMIVPLLGQNAEKGFPTASKGSIQRGQVYKRFAGLIDEAYRSFDSAGVASDGKGERPDEQNLQQLIRDVIVTTLGGKLVKDLELDSDLFVFGLNSLQTARIRNVLQKRLDLGDATLASNVVYEHATIRRLARHILVLRSGGASVADEKAAHRAMNAMVNKYGRFEAPASNGFSNGVDSEKQRVYLLTGATGSLGAHLLSQILRSSSTIFVVCLVRASDDVRARERVLATLAERRLPPLSEKQLARLSCYAALFGNERLGLGASIYDDLKTRTTCIIHLAWAVNFVASLESFETEQIAGVRHLGLLSARSRHHAAFFFGSSVASMTGKRPADGVVRETLPTEDASEASPLGYSRSKWVAERICQALAQDAGVPVTVLRIGQLCGDTAHGLWNETEGWPLMVKSAAFTGCLPDLEEPLNWFPVDLCATSVLDTVQNPPRHGTARVLHIVNEHKDTTWRDWLRVIRRDHADIGVIDVHGWLQALDESEPDPGLNPSRKLLELWRNRYSQPSADEWVPAFDVTQAAAVSPAVVGCQSLSDDLLRKMADRLINAQ